MAPPKGSKYAVKLKTDELKIEAYKSYCKHIAAGKSKEGWRYRGKEKFLCSYKTMEKYIKECPDILPSIHKEIAECDSFLLWEKKGEDMLNPEKKGKAEPAIYQMFMRNKFGWDKKDPNPEADQPAVETKVTLAEMKDINADSRVLPKTAKKLPRGDSED